MRRICICLIINMVFTFAAAAAGGLKAPQIKMNAPSMKMDVPAGGGASSNRDQMLMQKNIKDVREAQNSLAALSRQAPPDSAGDKVLKEWRQQSRRLKNHAGTLKSLVSRMHNATSDASGSDDYKQVKSMARDTISSLKNKISAATVKGDAADQRRQDALSAVNKVSIL